MAFDYIRETYDEMNSTLLVGSFVINATIHIAATDIKTGGLEIESGDIDGRFNNEFKFIPLGLPRFKRLKVVPINKSPGATPKIEYGLAGQFSPFDKWVSCLYSEAVIKNDRTYFDFSDYVLISKVKYRVKATYKDDFGIKTVLHVFLVKESNE
jgi:hypothetical protein